ncbi:MAG: hypothetical protein RLN75_03690, partial [Longimicrobiales bacterium]
MGPYGLDPELTDGQIYRSHFDEASALNAAYGYRPPGDQRPCIAVGACLPVDMRLSDGLAFEAPRPVRPADSAR